MIPPVYNFAHHLQPSPLTPLYFIHCYKCDDRQTQALRYTLGSLHHLSNSRARGNWPIPAQQTHPPTSQILPLLSPDSSSTAITTYSPTGDGILPVTHENLFALPGTDRSDSDSAPAPAPTPGKGVTPCPPHPPPPRASSNLGNSLRFNRIYCQPKGWTDPAAADCGGAAGAYHGGATDTGDT